MRTLARGGLRGLKASTSTSSAATLETLSTGTKTTIEECAKLCHQNKEAVTAVVRRTASLLQQVSTLEKSVATKVEGIEFQTELLHKKAKNMERTIESSDQEIKSLKTALSQLELKHNHLHRAVAEWLLIDSRQADVGNVVGSLDNQRLQCLPSPLQLVLAAIEAQGRISLRSSSNLLKSNVGSDVEDTASLQPPEMECSSSYEGVEALGTVREKKGTAPNEESQSTFRRSNSTSVELRSIGSVSPHFIREELQRLGYLVEKVSLAVSKDHSGMGPTRSAVVLFASAEDANEFLGKHMIVRLRGIDAVVHPCPS